MTKKTGSEIRRERREGVQPEKTDTLSARADLRKATLVAVIVFVGVWLIVMLVASEKGAFSEHEVVPPKKNPQTHTTSDTEHRATGILTTQARSKNRETTNFLPTGRPLFLSV